VRLIIFICFFIDHNQETHMKLNYTLPQIILAMAVAAAFSSPAYAGLDQMINGATQTLTQGMKLLNIVAGFVGAYFVFTGVMNWKKSSSEQGGHQMGFKEIVVPIIAGVCLLGFSAFIMLTSSTFGLTSSTVNNLN
jgi:hypothetical protein